MNAPLRHAKVLRRAFEHPTRGVIGLVDDLLTMGEEHGLQLDWQAGQCRVRFVGSDSGELLSVPLRKSVFRAILARLAVLCNERAPNSVSPYGGQGELAVGADPPVVFRVTFANTPADQRLRLMPLAAPVLTGEAWTILEYLRSGPKPYSRIRHFLYLEGWETRSSETSRIIDELIGLALVEVEPANGELRLTSQGRSFSAA